MSLLHLLSAGDGPNGYTAVTHIAVSSGVNSANVPWTEIAVFAGLNTTQLSVGSGPGQISSAEKANLDAGLILEIPIVILDNPSLVSSARLAYLDAQVTTIAAEVQGLMAKKYKWYGLTRG